MSLDCGPQALLAEDGPIARRLPGYHRRVEQQRMAAAVWETLTDRSVLIAEAGTGTGKTLAYAVPALAWGGRVLISTATANLQDQLSRRDLPLVRDALGGGVSIALLKGRGRYLCRLRLRDESEYGYADGRADKLARLRAWDQASPDGDLDAYPHLSDDDPLRHRVTVDDDTCLHDGCPLHGECWVTLARRKAVEADIVVVNHALLGADLAQRERGGAGFLPAADAIIVDEAHRFPEVISRSLGVSVGLRGIACLFDDLRATRMVPGLLETAADLLDAARNFHRLAKVGDGDCDWERRETEPALQAALIALRRRAETLVAMGAELGDSPGQEVLRRRCRALGVRLARLDFPAAGERARWLEVDEQGFSLTDALLDPGTRLRLWRERSPLAWIFTSATLAVGSDFSHFLHRIGAQGARTEIFQSPFDYHRQCLLYLPPGLPAPGAPAHTDAVVDEALPLITACEGRSFLLFTSQRALRRATERLRQACDLLVLAQGESPRDVLLKRFRAQRRSVLLGCASFWEGVDVRGAALSCVIIDKLPFSAPDDPLAKAEAEVLREAGGKPFKDYFLPRAILMLKQGVGRLIRDENDRGLLVICDPRIGSRGYGKLFLRALPSMPVSSDRGEALVFLEAIPASAEETDKECDGPGRKGGRSEEGPDRRSTESDNVSQLEEKFR